MRLVNERGAIWKRTGWYITPTSTREVMSIIGAIGVHSVGQPFAWRGMSSADYRLTSSIHRRLGPDLTEKEIRKAEVKLLADAQAWGLGIGETAYVDDLQLLADFQHYGIETRLLDFSSNPMTALWFACQAPGKATKTSKEHKGVGVSKSGVLLALNVSGWADYRPIGGQLTVRHMNNPNGATLAQAIGLGRAFLVRSSHPNERLRAQEGLFVASAVPSSSPLSRRLSTPFWSVDVPFNKGDPTALRDLLTSERVRGAPVRLPFVAVIIRSDLKRKLLAYLENAFNRRANYLFPDYAGFAEYAAHGGRSREPGAVARAENRELRPQGLDLV